MSTPSKSSTISPVVALAGLIIVSLLGIWFAISGFGFLAGIETIVRNWWPLILMITLSLLIFVLVSLKTDGLFIQISAIFIVVLLGAIFMATQGYRASSIYVQDLEDTDYTLNYADRAPWVVANQTSSRLQGEIRGTSVGVKSVARPSDVNAEDGVGTSRYTTLIDAPGLFTGYSAIQSMEMPVTGPVPTSAMTICDFPENMGKRLGHWWPGTSLDRVIHAEKKFVHYDRDDSYAYCDSEGSPIVVVPIFKYEGWLTTVKIPNGAMIYKDGEVTHMTADELVKAKIEGPTYPQSIASRQRASINADQGYWSYAWKEYGYDSTDKDSEDANVANASEFTLMDSTDNSLEYVTPLSPKGTSTSITAVAIVPAQQTKDGLGAFELNKSINLPSTSTLETNIRESSVNGDSNWTTRWAAGMGTYEILPGKDGHWVASIGQGQAVSYRADIHPDGTIVVTNVDTGQTSEDGDTPTEKGDSVTVDAGKPLSDMTEEELITLIGDAADELETRQNQTEE